MRPAACLDVARTAVRQRAASSPEGNNALSPQGRASDYCGSSAAHRDNVNRYRRMLRTPLTELERHFVERRLAEEHDALHDRVANEHSELPPADRAARESMSGVLNAAGFASMIDDVARELERP